MLNLFQHLLSDNSITNFKLRRLDPETSQLLIAAGSLAQRKACIGADPCGTLFLIVRLDYNPARTGKNWWKPTGYSRQSKQVVLVH